MKHLSAPGAIGRAAIATVGTVALVAVSYPAIALSKGAELPADAASLSTTDTGPAELTAGSTLVEEPHLAISSVTPGEVDSSLPTRAAEFTFPTLPTETTYTGANQVSGVSVPVYGLEGIPADQPFMVQINPAGGVWETIDHKTAGEILDAGSAVTIPRDKLTEPNYYYVQLSNYSLTPNYFEEHLATPHATIHVLELPMPQLASDTILRPLESDEPTILRFTGLSEYPDDQIFTINLAPPGEPTSHSEQVTVGELRTSGWTHSLPASYFTGGDAFFVEVTNWGTSPNYNGALIRMGAGISVRDLSNPTLPQSQVFLNEGELPEEVIFTLGNINTEVPGDQVINVQYGPAGAGDGWQPVKQYTLSELRTLGGKVSIPRELLDDNHSVYHVEITNWGMTPNYYPSDFILYGSIFIGDYSPPIFNEELIYTYLDTLDDVEFQLGNLTDLPDDQVINVQMGLSGSTSGWEELGTTTLGELRDNDGIITVPRDKLTELGTYYVQITNWGMSPNYYPEIFTVGAAIRVEASPTAGFYNDTGEPVESLIIAAGSPHDVNIGISGFVPNGATLMVQAYADGEAVFTSDEIPLEEQFDFSIHSVAIPESILQAQFGQPHTSLGVIAFVQLPDKYAGAEVDPALLDLTAAALAPEISFDKPSYAVTSGKALDFMVRGLEGLPADYPVELTLRSADGKLVWSELVTAEDVKNWAMTIRADATKPLRSGEYILTASVADYYDQITSASAEVAIQAAPVTPGGGGKDTTPGTNPPVAPKTRHLATTGGAVSVIAAASVLAAATGFALRRKARR